MFILVGIKSILSKSIVNIQADEKIVKEDEWC